MVASSFLGCVEADNIIIGMVDIRHNLNDFLRDFGGHIGFGVRPFERMKWVCNRNFEYGC